MFFHPGKLSLYNIVEEKRKSGRSFSKIFEIILRDEKRGLAAEGEEGDCPGLEVDAASKSRRYQGRRGLGGGAQGGHERGRLYPLQQKGRTAPQEISAMSAPAL